MANNIQIEIKTDGTLRPDQASVSVSGKNKDTVMWQADPNPDGTYPQWWIVFLFDPFGDNVIVTDPKKGNTKKLKAKVTPFSVACQYSISPTDPTPSKKAKSSTKRKKGIGIFGPGGGIIIDS